MSAPRERPDDAMSAPAPGLEEGLAALAGGDPDLALPAGAAALLGKWNRTYNLTAIREPARMVTHHVLDALAVLPHLPQRARLRVLDVGSGGGVPGIPLAIARPGWRVMLLDSSAKKCTFLRQAAIELPLANAEVACARIEDYASATPFDVVIARAFSDLATFAAAGARLLAPQGKLAAMKGARADEEAMRLPAGMRATVHALQVPGLDAQRCVVLVERAPGPAPRARAEARTAQR
jgi:16S rRNA (guanine527-N7)-methyltransferase